MREFVIICARMRNCLLIPQLAILTIVLAVLLGTSSAYAQVLSDIPREVSRLDDLVHTGRYVEAMKLAKVILDRLSVWQRDDRALPFLVYLGKAAVETGQPHQASTIFKSAEVLSATSWDKDYYEAALVREKAALYYAAGEYAAAAAAAARAYRLSNGHNYYRIRAEYCQSLQALAVLRMGNVREAERLALIAVKAAPKKRGKYSVFVPRILYTACIVTGHAGKTPDAEAFCRRGLEIASDAKGETRDLSLGYLAQAEIQLQAGDLARSREAALRGAEITNRLFGTQHQDMVDALVLQAMIHVREGDSNAARAKVNEASKIATALFGAGSAAATLPARVLR